MTVVIGSIGCAHTEDHAPRSQELSTPGPTLETRSVAAAEPSLLPAEIAGTLPCRGVVEQHLTKHQTLSLWSASESTEGKAFRSSNAVFGSWTELVAMENGSTEIRKLDKKQMQVTRIDQDCKTKITSLPGFDQARGKSFGESRSFVDDQALKKIIKEKKTGMIYLWSPGFSYSMKFYARFKAVAKAHGVVFIPLMDPVFDDSRAQGVARAAGIREPIRRSNSVELYMRKAMLHYPSVALFRDGFLLNEVITGVHEEGRLNQFVELLLRKK